MVGEIETDKTSIPINSPAAGVIEELLVEDGSTVQPGMDIFKMRVGATASATSQPAASTAAAAAAPTPTPAPAKPVKEASAAPPAAKSAPVKAEKAAAATPSEQHPDTGPSYGEQRVKMNRMRLRIAQRLKDAQNTYAMLTTFNEIDMT